MFVNDTHIEALRAVYKRRLLTDSITAAVSLVIAVALLARPDVFAGYAWIIAVCVAAAAAIADYFLEQMLYRRGKNATIILVLSMLLPAIALSILLQCGIIPGADGSTGFSYFPTFVLLRALIPLIQLLRDGAVLKEGKPCESVGRMKENTRRVENGISREFFMLFEDELTHEIHLIRMSSLSPEHRYRVFYLPHSGLAVGEIVPDHVTFDPFGNPITREADTPIPADRPITAQESASEKDTIPADKPDYDEGRGYADKPVYTEEAASSKSPYREGPAHTDPTATTAPAADPHSPERQKAAKLERAGKVCTVATFAIFILGFIVAFLLRESSVLPLSFVLFLPGVGGILLSAYFQNKSLKLRCTARTAALCVDTVRRKSGKTTTRHPIVEYTVNGVLYTRELYISCRRDAVGEMYTIYYDPLEPGTVRAK